MGRIRSPVEKERIFGFGFFGQKSDQLVSENPGQVGLVGRQVYPEFFVVPKILGFLLHLWLTVRTICSPYPYPRVLFIMGLPKT